VVRAALVAGAIFGLHVPANLGYVGLGVLVGIESMGVPSPGETALVIAAVLASRGKLDIVTVILVAAAAAIIGDNLGYLIGRRGGRRLLTRRGPLHARRLQLIEYGDRFFARHGAKAVFFGRWMALVRVTAAWMAGANRMPPRRFFVYNALGGISWAASVALVAYWLGAAGGHILATIGTAGAIAFGLVVVLGFLWLRRRGHRAVRADAGGAEGAGRS